MVTEMITLKLEKDFLSEIDALLKGANYHNRTEFIREALREKLQQVKKQELIEHLNRLRGSVKEQTNQDEYERIRKMDFKHIDSEKLFRLARGTDVPKR